MRYPGGTAELALKSSLGEANRFPKGRTFFGLYKALIAACQLPQASKSMTVNNEKDALGSYQLYSGGSRAGLALVGWVGKCVCVCGGGGGGPDQRHLSKRQARLGWLLRNPWVETCGAKAFCWIMHAARPPGTRQASMPPQQWQGPAAVCLRKRERRARRVIPSEVTLLIEKL